MDAPADFYGWPVRCLGNAHLALQVLAEAGPRLVRLLVPAPAGSGQLNLLAEAPDAGWDTPFGPYHLFGGHRLWHAPETDPDTYYPDSRGLTVFERPGGLLLAALEGPPGLRKNLEVSLDPDRPALRLVHRLENVGSAPRQVAPWAITMLPLGGTVWLPQAPALPNRHALQPDRHLVLWPYAHWDDPRLALSASGWRFEARPGPGPFKLGYLSPLGWVAYTRGGCTLTRRFTPEPGRAHPDWNCNVELYCNGQFLELEILGPLVTLAPGETTELVEEWEVTTDEGVTR